MTTGELHEMEMRPILIMHGPFEEISYERDPNGWHIKDGKCDCSFDCCLIEDENSRTGYKCICPDCPTPNCVG